MYNPWTNYISNTCRSYIKTPGQKPEKGLEHSQMPVSKATSSTDKVTLNWVCRWWMGPGRHSHIISHHHGYLEVPPGVTIAVRKKKRHYQVTGKLLVSLLIKLTCFFFNVKRCTPNITAASIQTRGKPLSSRGKNTQESFVERQSAQTAKTKKANHAARRPSRAQCPHLKKNNDSAGGDYLASF